MNKRHHFCAGNRLLDQQVSCDLVEQGAVIFQDLLNAIMPSMLSVVAVGGVFAFLKKGTSVFKIMIAMFIIAVACSLIGIL